MRLPLLVSASLSVPGVLGWGAAGHEIVATIAQIHLHPTVFPTVCSILNFTNPNPNEPPCHLAPIAAWADKVRYNMRWSAPLHYVGALDDYPSQTCAFPGHRGWAGKEHHNILGAVRNVTDILDDYITDGSVSNDAANEALKFLVHFLGDLHMPLHLTGRDRGGNSDKVKFGGRVTNLHSLWDGLLIAKAIRETPYNYTRPLPSRQIERSLRGTIYDSYVRRIMWEGVLSQWKDDLPTWVSCPSPSPSLPSSTTLLQTVFSPLTRLLPFRLPLLSAITHSASATDDATLCPYTWASPIHALNCDIVWPKALDEPPYKNASRISSSFSPNYHIYDHDDSPSSNESTPPTTPEANNPADDLSPTAPPLLQLDTPEYAGLIAERMIIEKLLAQAGIRLAATLNWLFADFAEDAGGSSSSESRVRGRQVRVVEV